MLAGCSSSTLLSPRHSLRSEASHQACHFQLPSMSTQRLDLPCSFSRKDASSRPQPIRPPVVGLPLEKQPVVESNNNRSLKQSIRLPPLATTAGSSYEGRRETKDELWEKGKSLKRLAEDTSVDEESYMSRSKRNKGSNNDNGDSWFDQSHPFSLTYSGDEEKACFVPGLPLSHSPWFAQITDSGEKDAEIIIRRPGREEEEASGSSNSSESGSLGLRLAERRPAAEGEVVGHGSGRSTRQAALVESRQVMNNNNSRELELDLQLVNFLVSCIEAISSKNIPAINHFIAKLGDLASPRGRTTISRLIGYYTEGLALRVTRLWPHIFHITPPRELDRFDDAFRLLNQVSPIPKFIHFTANEILLRAFEGKDRVHIIDFNIKQGLQWPSFFQSLASRANPPSHVRITGIGDSKHELNETGDRLTLFAEAMNLPFEFHPVVDRLEDVRLWMLHVKEKECVAVNCILQLQKLLYDTNGAVLRDFLGLIQSTNPAAVVMAEQEAEHNIQNMETRVCSSLRYYSAIFDSLDYSLSSESPIRTRIEQMFACEIRNLVACEGSDRHERHERFSSWGRLLEQGGFRCMGITERELLQCQMLLKMYSRDGFRVSKQGREGGGAEEALTLSWSDQPLFAVSAWTPVDVAGSSSS